MKMMMRTMVKRIIRLFVSTQILIFLTYLISFEIYINVEIAFLSSYFIILGSTFAYKKMISTQIEADIINQDRTLLDIIEDPHELYDDTSVNDKPEEELDLREIVKQEKKKIKRLNLSDFKNGSKAGFSPLRLAPYAFLILSFIALENNKLLDIKIYLPSLLIGIIIGYNSTKKYNKHF